MAIVRQPALPVALSAAPTPPLPPPRRDGSGLPPRTVSAASTPARISATSYTRTNYLMPTSTTAQPGLAKNPAPLATMTRPLPPAQIAAAASSAAAPLSLNGPSRAVANELPRAIQTTQAAAASSSKFASRSRRVFISPRILQSTAWTRTASTALSAAPASTAQAASSSSSVGPKASEPHRPNSSFRFASKKPAPVALKWRRASAAASAPSKSAPSTALLPPRGAPSSLPLATRDKILPASLSFDRRAQIPCPQWQRRGECPVHSLWLKHRPATTTTASIAAHASSLRSSHGSFSSKSSSPPPCPFLHDPMQVPICRAFVRGKCRRENCPLSHRVRAHRSFAHVFVSQCYIFNFIKYLISCCFAIIYRVFFLPFQLTRDRMPVCSNFLRGQCFDDECRYSHVRVARDAPICAEFQDGHCSRGEACKFRHTYARVGVALSSSLSSISSSSSSSSADTAAPSSLRQVTRPASSLASAVRASASNKEAAPLISGAAASLSAKADSSSLKRPLPAVASISAADGGASEADRSAKVAKQAEISDAGASAASIFPSFLRHAMPTGIGI